MKLQPQLDALAADLLQSARVGGDDMHAAAERLVAALEPASRLMVLDVLSQACAEITAELDSGTVEVRLAGREPEIVVTPGLPPMPPVPPSAEPAPEPAEPDPADLGPDGPLARVTVRVPEPVKVAAEARAAEAGQSLNTWIVAAMRAATHPAPPPPPEPPAWPGQQGHVHRSGRVMRGWV